MRKRRKPKYWPDTHGVCWYVREPLGGYAGDPHDIAPTFKDLAQMSREEFWIVTFTQKMREIDRYQISVGSLTVSLVHPREVFKPAVMDSAAFIVTVHNHPSGVVTPSKPDMDVHKRLEDVGELLGIKVRDMIIIGRDRFYSQSAGTESTWPVEEARHV